MARRAFNEYYKHSHISEAKFRQLIKCFALDLNAYETSKITNISHVSYKKVFHKSRVYIFNNLNNLLENEVTKEKFELDESYSCEYGFPSVKNSSRVLPCICTLFDKKKVSKI